MSIPRLYISAVEIVSPAGWGVATHLESLFAERCFLRLDNGNFVGILPDFIQAQIKASAQEKKLRYQDPLSRLAVLATRSLFSGGRPRGKFGVVMGSSRGATTFLEASWKNFFEGRSSLPSSSPATTAGSLAAAVAREAESHGPSLVVSAACTTGIYSIIQACGMIRMGMAPSMLAGGAEYANTEYTIALLKAAKVYSKNEERNFPCQPGGVQRSGMILSEGAALILIESDPMYQPLGEIVGWGGATEETTSTGVSPDGEVLVQAIDQALKIAKIDADSIDLIIGHGAGTIKGDLAEMSAYSRRFNERVPIVWHKWMAGHMLGASAAASLILGLEHLRHGLVPGHPYLPFGHLQRESRRLFSQRYLLVASLGFGGNAAVLIVKNPALG